MKKKLLFVCLGNICRSPSAEAVMNSYLEMNRLNGEINCDSAGTMGWHTGEKADNRAIKHANKRGFNITSRARQFNPNIDFDKFDLILGMDKQNVKDLNSMARNESDLLKIQAITNFCSRYIDYDSVPDPYYGGEDGFELVLDILEDACEGLLNHVKK